MTATKTVRLVDCRSTGWRLARTLLIVGVSLWLGSVSHVLGGGHIPRSGLALALSLPLIGAVFALTRFTLGFVACLPLLGLDQLAVHGLLMIGSISTGDHTSILGGAPVGTSSAHVGGTDMHQAAGVAHVGMMHSGHALSGGTDSMTMGNGSMPMLLAHVIGTVLAAAVVGAVDATLWVLAVLILPWVARLMGVAPLCRKPAPTGFPDASEALPQRKPRALDPVRGPPLHLAFS